MDHTLCNATRFLIWAPALLKGRWTQVVDVICRGEQVGGWQHALHPREKEENEKEGENILTCHLTTPRPQNDIYSPPFHLLLSLSLPQLGNPRRPKPADQTKVFHVLRPYQRKKFRRITDESLVVILTTTRLSDPRLTGYLNCIRYREQRPQVAWTRCWPSLLLLISFSAHT